MKNKYVIALYCRISRADIEFGKGGDESRSIRNQIEMLLNYVRQMPEYEQAEVKIFADDGYTGRNFERPEFIKMQKLIYENRIDCIVVKDFSRFGRDYIELGDYLEQIFPVYNVRFISLNDHYDTSVQSDPSAIDVGFKNLIYTYYSKDLSEKALKSVEQRKREGRFTAGPVRFGFTKKIGSKIELEIDEKAAEIIRYIFSLAAKGMKTRAIAIRLNQESVLTPAMYSYRYNQKCKWNLSDVNHNYWTQNGVARILRDERYAGTYVEYVKGEQGRECIRIPNKYPQIISLELFHNAQEILRKRKVPKNIKESDNIFKGIIKCGNCNHALALSRAKQGRYFYCKYATFNKDQKCFGEHFSEQELKECVLKSINDYILMLEHTGEKKVKELTKRSKKATKMDKAYLKKEIEKLDRQFVDLYEQYRAGLISKQSFSEKREGIQEQKKTLEREQKFLEDHDTKILDLQQARKQYSYQPVTDLSEELVKKYLKRIFIDQSNRIKLVWKIANPFEKFF